MMRRVTITATLAAAMASFACTTLTPPAPDSTDRAEPVAQPAGSLYDADPEHIWNRADRSLRVRTTADGRSHGGDALDPLLWPSTRHLLTAPSHEWTLAVLDGFLSTDAERLVTDPVKRAVFQRDLWAIFDWAVSNSGTHSDARRALAARLARMIRRVALTPEQIAQLPDSYAAAVAARRYPAAHDPAQRDRPFLPVRLVDPEGPWIPIHGTIALGQHSDEMSRSSFGVFLTVPGGRAATSDYLKRLWEAPEPFVIDPVGSFGGQTMTAINPSLHAVPFGTQVALVRRMLLIDTTGLIRPSGLVESVQIRVFRKPEPCRVAACGHNDQDFFEFVLSRPGLVSNPALGLRAVQTADEEFLTFSSHDIDPFERPPVLPLRPGRVLERCVACHNAPGLASIMTARRLFKPTTFADAGGPGGDGMPDFWKTRRADWGWLQALWRSQPR